MSSRREVQPLFKVIIDTSRCKGCGLCVSFCPKDNLELSEELSEAGYHPAQIVSEDECTGCQMCVLMCPDVCIEIYKQVAEAKANE